MAISPINFQAQPKKEDKTLDTIKGVLDMGASAYSLLGPKAAAKTAETAATKSPEITVDSVNRYNQNNFYTPKSRFG